MRKVFGKVVIFLFLVGSLNLNSMDKINFPNEEEQSELFEEFYNKYFYGSIGKFFKQKKILNKINKYKENRFSLKLINDINNTIKEFLRENDDTKSIESSLIKDSDDKNFINFSSLIFSTGCFYISPRRILQENKIYNMFHLISKLFPKNNRPNKIFLSNAMFESFNDLFTNYFKDQIKEIYLHKMNNLKNIDALYNCKKLRKVVITYSKDRIIKEKKGSISRIKLSNEIVNLEKLKYLILPLINGDSCSSQVCYTGETAPSKREIIWSRKNPPLDFLSISDFAKNNKIYGLFELDNLDTNNEFCSWESLILKKEKDNSLETKKSLILDNEEELFSDEDNKKSSLVEDKGGLSFSLLLKFYYQTVINRFFQTGEASRVFNLKEDQSLMTAINEIIASHFGNRIKNKNLMKTLMKEDGQILSFRKFITIILSSGCFYISGRYTQDMDDIFSLLQKIYVFLVKNYPGRVPDKLFVSNSNFREIPENISQSFSNCLTSIYLTNVYSLTDIESLKELKNLKRLFITFSKVRITREKKGTISSLQLPNLFKDLQNLEYIVVPQLKNNVVETVVIYKGKKPELEEISGYQLLENPRFIIVEDFFKK